MEGTIAGDHEYTAAGRVTWCVCPRNVGSTSRGASAINIADRRSNGLLWGRPQNLVFCAGASKLKVFGCQLKRTIAARLTQFHVLDLRYILRYSFALPAIAVEV